MGQNNSALRRYRVIDGLLRNTMRRYPTMDDIIDACERKLDSRPSLETIQKDIANMRLPQPDGFDAPIRYCRLNKGYYYTDPDFSLQGVSLRADELMAIMEAVDLVRSIAGSRMSHKFRDAAEKLFSATLENIKEREQDFLVLQTMTPPVSKGFEHFDLFYQACSEKLPISFVHFSYTKRNFNHIIIHPFLIKEFDNRWYIIGFSENHNEVRTFGLDRISVPLIIKRKFLSTDKKIIYAYLNDVYGVFPVPGAQKETITIHADELGTHYFQSYPIHESQVIKKESEGSSVISFQLIPSVELARFMLSQGKQINVLTPSWFKKFTLNLMK